MVPGLSWEASSWLTTLCNPEFPYHVHRACHLELLSTLQAQVYVKSADPILFPPRTLKTFDVSFESECMKNVCFLLMLCQVSFPRCGQVLSLKIVTTCSRHFFILSWGACVLSGQEQMTIQNDFLFIDVNARRSNVMMLPATAGTSVI